MLGAFEPKKSHIYFGAMVGLAPIKITPKPVSDSSYTAFLWGAKGGYQFAFFKALALRGEFSYLMAIKPTALHTINTSLLSLNVDVLSDFYTYKKYSFGVYGGLGIGYFYQFLKKLGIEIEDYDELQNFFEKGVQENLNSALALYGNTISLAQLYARFHGKIVEFSKQKLELKL
ncbi:hypothetical protein VN0301_07140 [Helicobacter pylori]